MKELLNKIKRQIKKIIMYEEYLNWKDNEDFKKNVIELHYDNVYSALALPTNRRIISMLNGFEIHGGLADRLRGIISTYKFAKDNNISFSIYWVEPFNLCDYLEPNLYDWRIEGDEIFYSLQNTTPIHIGSFYKRMNTSEKAEKVLQQKWMKRAIHRHPNSTQYHVYSNAHFGESQFKELFEELFKPADKIKEKLDKLKKEMSDYVSITTRFQQLLGDFNEPGFKTLEPEEQHDLIEKCINYIEYLHTNQLHGKSILCTSDSITFLSKVRRLPYVYVIPSKIFHIDHMPSMSYEAYEKSFLDLFMISKAEKAILLQTGDMYQSGFPKCAAMIGGIDFIHLKF